VSIRERIEELEQAILAPQAVKAAESKGREDPEEPHPYRTCFMRDRDRILHTKAFRRLAHKTQVFVAPEGDHHRVRLTHTLEVTQIARTIARCLRLNEDLAEAICLGHDLGHTPFGHLGEEVVSEFLGRQFRHNEQSLRILDHLEFRRSGDELKRGLNLTFEVRDGVLNHTWSMPLPGSAEGEIARYADRIAYLSHDIDDAIRAGVLTTDALPESTNRVLGTSPSSRIDKMVTSVVQASAGAARIQMDPEVFEVLLETREFMFEAVYNRAELRERNERMAAMLADVLAYYRRNPKRLPELSGHTSVGPGLTPPESSGDHLETMLVDYVSGMTDRFAISEHARLIELGEG